MEIFIAIGVALAFVLLFGLAYLHYQWVERGRNISNQYPSDELIERQLDANGYDPNMKGVELGNKLWRFDALNGKEREWYSLMLKAEPFLKRKKFELTRSVDDGGNISMIWEGRIKRQPVKLYLSASSTSRKFEDFMHLTEVYKINEGRITGGMDADINPFIDEFVKACLCITEYQKERISKETTVYSVVNDSFTNGALTLTPMPTSKLFKYGEVIQACPKMFSANVKASFNGKKMENFDIRQVASFIENALTKVDANISGLFFGAPGLGKTSMTDALAWYLGRNRKLMVIRVNGPVIADAKATASLLTLIKRENEMGRKPVIIADEMDSHLELSDKGRKTPQSEALMSLMNEVSVFATCNLQDNEIHEAFKREGRGHFQVHLNPLSPEQIPIITDYVKAKADQNAELVFHPWKGAGIPTLAQLWMQIQHKSVDEMMNGLWEDVKLEHEADKGEISGYADTDWEEVSAEVKEADELRVAPKFKGSFNKNKNWKKK